LVAFGLLPKTACEFAKVVDSLSNSPENPLQNGRRAMPGIAWTALILLVGGLLLPLGIFVILNHFAVVSRSVAATIAVACGAGLVWLLVVILGVAAWCHAAGKVTAIGAVLSAALAAAVALPQLSSRSGGRDASGAELDGSWTGVTWEGADGKRDDLTAVGTHLTIQGTKIKYNTRNLGGDEIEGLIATDATLLPKTFDAGGSKAFNIDGNPGSTYFYWTGIYELKGDTLRLCFVNRGAGERPKEFKANPATLLVLKRDRQ
jgi:uncharacterized protein (TIGR03067 family)